MKKDIEQLNVDFNATAQKCYYDICSRFEKADICFSRRQHETEFLRLHAMYLELLKTSLEAEALFLVEHNRDMYDVYLLQKAFLLHIERYLDEFRFKYRVS